MATLNQITNANWQLSTTNAGGVVQGLADIAQCIQIILTTQRGSCVLRPTFGVDAMSYISQPINVVKADLIREIIDQIETWEERVTIDKITSNVDGSTITINIAWNSNLGTGTNNVIYAITA